MVPNWCSFLSQLANHILYTVNIFAYVFLFLLFSHGFDPKRAGSTSRHGWLWKGPLRWRARGLGTWRKTPPVFEPTNVVHPSKVTKVYGRWIYKKLQAEQIRQQHARRWRLQWPFEKGRERKWRFGMDKGCQGWFQGHPIMVPLYGKFPVLYGNSMENLPNKGVPLLGVPDNPTELESQECCWSTLDLAKIHPC